MYYECSAMTGENIEDIFTGMSKSLLNKIDSGLIAPTSVVSSYANSIKQVSSEGEKDPNCKKKSGCLEYSCFV
jgi:hypothetical protein